MLTNDDVSGERAWLARHLLNLLGRPDVPVIAGVAAAGPGRPYAGFLDWRPVPATRG